MKKVFKWLGLLLLVVVLAVSGFLLAMRFHDGPLEIVSGGPFKTGELTDAPADWSFLEGRDTIEFQTMLPATSRLVWLAVVEDRLFIASAYMTTDYGKIWKQWPHYLEEDDQIILRIDGKLYERRLQRLMDDPIVLPVLEKFITKYSFPFDADMALVAEGHVWLYEVVAR